MVHTAIPHEPCLKFVTHGRDVQKTSSVCMIWSAPVLPVGIPVYETDILPPIVEAVVIKVVHLEIRTGVKNEPMQVNLV